MGHILWIDENTFATKFLEKIFKKKGMEFYSLSAAKEFIYLVDDLKPSLLVLDFKTALKEGDELVKLYKSSEALRVLPTVLVDPAADLAFITKKIGSIYRPFDPFTVPDLLQELLSQRSI